MIDTAEGRRLLANIKALLEIEASGNMAPIPRLPNAARQFFEQVLSTTPALLDAADRETFQARVAPWMDAYFGPEISADRVERNDRFLEEALELVQASGCDKQRAHALVEYVFNRPQGDINQEVGGVMVTLAAHCLAHGVDMHAAAETELARIWKKVETIRAKQAAKPKGSVLPVAWTDPRIAALERECDRLRETSEAFEVLRSLWEDPATEFEKKHARYSAIFDRGCASFFAEDARNRSVIGVQAVLGALCAALQPKEAGGERS